MMSRNVTHILERKEVVMDFEIKERNIFHDVMDRYQFIDGKKYLVPKLDDLPIKKVKTEYVVTEITADGQKRYVFDRDGLEAWKERNKNGLEKRIYYKLVKIEELNVFEADL